MATSIMANTFDYNYKWSFVGEWFDYESSYLKKFIINYYPADNTLELFDKGCNRMFLKRAKLEQLGKEDMYVGNTIRIYGRQIKITDYLDSRTYNYVGKFREKTCVLIKPNVTNKLGEIINIIQENNFLITKLKMVVLNRTQALDFYAKLKADPVIPFIVENIVSGPIVVLELLGEYAVRRWLDLIGPADPVDARNVAPNSLRAIYGKDSQATNGFHGSLTVEDGIRESDFLFSNQYNPPEPIVQLRNTTCCLIKPHAIQEGKLGHIINSINQSRFQITGANMLNLSNSNADELLEVYKGVVSDYNAFLLSYMNGACVALEIAAENGDMNVHEEFRKFVGPTDANVAKQIRPYSLRAKYGCDNYKNAVHCTDLPEDTFLELEYLFKILKDA